MHFNHLSSKTNFRPTITWKSDYLLPCKWDLNPYLMIFVGVPGFEPGTSTCAIRKLRTSKINITYSNEFC